MDRLSHVFTVILIIVLAVVITTAQFVGDPIHCWHPAEWKGWYEHYAENYCWISNTYVVGFDEIFPVNITDRKEAEIAYYQWIPLILMFQAFWFKFPNVVWKLLHTQCGLDLNKIVRMAQATQLFAPVKRQEVIEQLACIMDKWIDTEQVYKWNRAAVAKKRLARFCCLFCSKRHGTYLAGLYTTVKFLYLANLIGQFLMLNAFMAMDYTVFGIEVLSQLSDKRPWTTSPRFPLVTFCDVEIRQLQNIQRYTIQCVLPVNLYNEKVFVAIWFWMFFVLIITIIKLAQWCFTVGLKRHRTRFVLKYLQITGLSEVDFDRKVFHNFAHHYLREDGVFVLRAVTSNSTDLVTTDLVSCLWRKYLAKRTKPPDNTHDRENELLGTGREPKEDF